MVYLIRTIENREGGSFEHRDNEYSGEEIAIGRATGQDIQLTEPEVALHHAVIYLRGDGRGTVKAASSAAAVSVNDRVVRRSPLKRGDVVRIGESVFTVMDPPAGFDFALTLERGEADVDEDAVPPGSQYVTTLSAAGLRKRRWSWVLFLVIAVGFLLLPASGLFDQRLQAFLRATPGVPDDGVWQTGALHQAHSSPTMVDNCEVCHVQPFVPVSDEQCTACHGDVGKHAEVSENGAQ